jgi:hypothetical protein
MVMRRGTPEGLHSKGPEQLSYPHSNVKGLMNVLGQGIWYSFHLLATEARTYQRYLAFMTFTDVVIRGLPCFSCKEDTLVILRDNPPPVIFPPYPIDGNIICFIWSWRVHNIVNERLGKRILPLTVASEGYPLLNRSTPPSCTCKE